MRCATASPWRNCPTSRKCCPREGSTARRWRVAVLRGAGFPGHLIVTRDSSGLLGREERFDRVANGLGRGAEAIQEVAGVAAFDGQDAQQEVAAAGAWMAALVGFPGGALDRSLSREGIAKPHRRGLANLGRREGFEVLEQRR